MTELASSVSLLAPFDLSGLALRNRVVMAPMTRGRAGSERIPNALMAVYYRQRAGAGLIISEATVVSKQGIGWIDSPGLYTDAQEAGWHVVTEAVHAEGKPFFAQLWHCGRASHSSFHGRALPVAPSAVKLKGEYIHTPQGKQRYETPRALEPDEIPVVVEDYRLAHNERKPPASTASKFTQPMGTFWISFCSQKPTTEPMLTGAATRTGSGSWRKCLRQ